MWVYAQVPVGRKFNLDLNAVKPKKKFRKKSIEAGYKLQNIVTN